MFRKHETKVFSRGRQRLMDEPQIREEHTTSGGWDARWSKHARAQLVVSPIVDLKVNSSDPHNHTQTSRTFFFFSFALGLHSSLILSEILEYFNQINWDL